MKTDKFEQTIGSQIRSSAQKEGHSVRRGSGKGSDWTLDQFYIIDLRVPLRGDQITNTTSPSIGLPLSFCGHLWNNIDTCPPVCVRVAGQDFTMRA